MGTDFGRTYARQMAKAFTLSSDIVRMTKDGHSIPEIAKETELPPKIVKSVLRSSGDTIPSKGGSGGWTPEQDATILRMKQREGRMWGPIGEAVGRTADDVSKRFTYLCSDAKRKAKWKTKKISKCMTCREEFIQEYKFHRRCNACKATEAGLPDSFLVVTSGGRDSHGHND